VEAALFGADPYVVCPICEQNVPEELQTWGYKKRWREATLPQLDDRAVRVAMLAIYLRRGLSGDEDFDSALKHAQAAYSGKTIHELKSLGDRALLLLDTVRRTR
jgi:hypothetical protein